MNKEMAAVAGMSPEEFAALSNKEKKKAMIRQGDIDAMMAMVGKQAQMAQQQMARQQAKGMPSMSQGMTPEMVKAHEAGAGGFGEGRNLVTQHVESG